MPTTSLAASVTIEFSGLDRATFDLLTGGVLATPIFDALVKQYTRTPLFDRLAPPWLRRIIAVPRWLV